MTRPRAVADLVDHDVFLPRRGDAEVPHSLLHMDADGRRWLVAFSTLELAVSADLDQDDVWTTSLWDALRTTLPGTGLVIDPGQDGSVALPENLIEGVLGGPREQALPLSPGAVVALAERPVVVMLDASGRAYAAQADRPAICAWSELGDARAAVPDDARAHEALLGDLCRDLAAPGDANGLAHSGIVLDAASLNERVIDLRLGAALHRALELFPPGHEAGVRPPTHDTSALTAALVTALPPEAARCWLAEYQTYGGRPRLLVVVDTRPDQAAATSTPRISTPAVPLFPGGQIWNIWRTDLPAELREDPDRWATRLPTASLSHTSGEHR